MEEGKTAAPTKEEQEQRNLVQKMINADFAGDGTEYTVTYREQED